MTRSPALPAVGILLCLLCTGGVLCAQAEPFVGEQDFAPYVIEDLPAPDDQLFAPSAEPLVEPHWGEPPYRRGIWKFAVDFTATDFELTQGPATYWSIEPTIVDRFEIAFESHTGLGTRVQLWVLDKTLEFKNTGGSSDTRIASYYWDVYRRLDFQKAEFLLGGGLAVGNLKFDTRVDSPFFYKTSRFTGVGASLVGEGFYPLLRLKSTDFGLIGHARLAVLGPLEDNFDNDSQAVLVDDVGLGIEIRRRFGKRQDKSFFVSLAREYQHWTDADSSLSVDQDLQSTSLRLGLAW